MSEKLTSNEPLSPETIRVGSIIELHYADDPEDDTMTLRVIASSNDSVPGETLLDSLPLAKILTGKQPGDIVCYTSPDGEEYDIEVVSVDNSSVVQAY